MGNMEGEQDGVKGTYVYVEGVDGAEGQYYFVPEGQGGPEFNKEIAVPSSSKDFAGKGQIPAGATAMTAEQMAGKMPPGKPVSFLAMQGDKKKKKASDDDDDEETKIAAPTGEGGGFMDEMNKKKNKAKRKKSREEDRRKNSAAEGGATYDTVKPKLLDK